MFGNVHHCPVVHRVGVKVVDFCTREVLVKVFDLVFQKTKSLEVARFFVDDGAHIVFDVHALCDLIRR